MKKKPVFTKNNTLLDTPLFSEFEVSELRKISAFSSLQRVKKKAQIFFEGDNYRGFYIVFKGKVKVYKMSSSGRESVLHIVSPFDAFADVPLFEARKTYPVSAEALEDSVLFFIPKEQFLEFIKVHPEINFKIITGFASKLRNLTNRIEDLTMNEINIRLAKYLLGELSLTSLSGNPPPSFKLTISKSTLAGYLGTITETLSRTFNKLHSDGIIKVDGKVVTVLDVSKLRELAQ